MFLRDFVESMLTQIDDQVDAAREELASGKASDLADYKRRCGRITGLREAAEIIKKGKIQYADDDE